MDNACYFSISFIFDKVLENHLFELFLIKLTTLSRFHLANEVFHCDLQDEQHTVERPVVTALLVKDLSVLLVTGREAIID